MRYIPSIDELSFVFVVTYGRSGSTILNNVLNSIPGYLIRGENHAALFRLHQAAEAARVTHDRFGTPEMKKGVESPFYGASRLAPARWRDALAASFVAEVLQPGEGTRVAGFKEIRHTPNIMTDEQFRAYFEFLLTAFPRARVVFNTRAAEEVARSGWWREQPEDEVKRVVARSDARFHAAHAAMPGRSIVMHYNDYATSPDAFAPLFAFLGERFDRDKVAEVMTRRVSHPRKALRERSVDLA